MISSENKDVVARLTDITRRFGKINALDGLDLTVREGEVYGFLGRNGAGKTTALRVLMGVLRPDSGRVELMGESVRRVPISIKQRIGYVAQEQVFYSWMSARDLGRFLRGLYPSWDDEEYHRLLERLDVPLKQRSGGLSGGTRTKLGLALALAHRPRLLLLDEPTAGLDPVARREFNDLVREMVRERGVTALLSSHLVDEVEGLADRIGIIQEGRLLYEGGVEALLTEVRRVIEPPAAVVGSGSDVPAEGPAPGVADSAPLAGAAVDGEHSLDDSAPIADPAAPDQPPSGDCATTTGPTDYAEPLPIDQASPLPPLFPTGFTRVRGDVWRAPQSLWARVRMPEGARSERISLEEVFLAFARSDSPEQAA